MSTERQRAANRANAQKSTGPRTAEGKAASSANALKTGIYAKSTLLPGEDPAEYDALRQEHYDQFQPANTDERDLLDLMVKYKWQLRRLHDCYDQMWLREVEDNRKSEYYRPTAPLVGPFIHANLHSPNLIDLSRMIHSTDRAFHRTRAALIKTQSDRLRQAAKAAQLTVPKTTSPNLSSFAQKPADTVTPPPTSTEPPTPLTHSRFGEPNPQPLFPPPDIDNPSTPSVS